MIIGHKKGFTLVETLIAAVLISTLFLGTLGAFFISGIVTERARHRMVAMAKIREYMALEMASGYLGGSTTSSYYVTFSSSNPVSVTIDDRGTTDTGDDLTGTLTPSPYPATRYSIGSADYKLIGFVVQWNEAKYGGARVVYKERLASYVAYHK